MKNIKIKRRKIMAVLAVFLIFFLSFYGRFDINNGFIQNAVYADSTQESDLETQLKEEVDKQLANLDFSGIETSRI